GWRRAVDSIGVSSGRVGVLGGDDGHWTAFGAAVWVAVNCTVSRVRSAAWVVLSASEPKGSVTVMVTGKVYSPAPVNSAAPKGFSAVASWTMKPSAAVVSSPKTT